MYVHDGTTRTLSFCYKYRMEDTIEDWEVEQLRQDLRTDPALVDDEDAGAIVQDFLDGTNPDYREVLHGVFTDFPFQCYLCVHGIRVRHSSHSARRMGWDG
jgi:hypothetical protein